MVKEKFSAAQYKAIAEATKGITQKTLQLSKSRMKICNECEFLFVGFCKHCICFMPVKTTLKNSECPIGKWRALQDG